MSADTDEYFNLDYKSVLRESESVSFTRAAFNIPTKFLWRQTADRLIVALDQKSRWFRNTIQCAWVKEEYSDSMDPKFVLGVLNSSYYAWAYDRLVREAGRVFPQVKIGNVKQLPFAKADSRMQKRVASLVDKIIKTVEWNNPASLLSVSNVQKEIDRLTFELFGVTETLQKDIDLFVSTSKAKLNR